MTKNFATRLSYPSPLRRVEMEIHLPEAARLTLQLFDETGREFATIVESANYSAGVHTIDFDLPLANDGHGSSPRDSNTPEAFEPTARSSSDSGFYYCRLLAEGETRSYIDTKRLSLPQ